VEADKTVTAAEEAVDVRFNLSDDFLTVTMECDAAYLAQEEVLKDIERRLAEMKVKPEYIVPDLDQIIRDQRNGDSAVITIDVAQGVAPILPVEGEIKWERDFLTKDYHIDPETNCIDFRRFSAVQAVDKGDLLATIIAPKSGKDGESVIGKPIPVAKPKRISLRAGRNVSWNEGALTFRSTIAGHFRLVGNTIHVEDVYQKSGDVDSSSGNIDHKGTLIIGGSVQPGFEIRATGSIEVKGSTGPCNIECGDKLTIKQGMTGGTGSTIKSESDVSAKFICQAQIESGGSVMAVNEIVQSEIQCCGQVVCKGRIVGGQTQAGQSIIVNECGCKGGTATVVTAGVDYRTVRAHKECAEAYAKMEKQLETASSTKHKLEIMQHHLNNLQKEALTELVFLVDGLTVEVEEMRQKKLAFERQLSNPEGAYIEVLGTIHPGTTLRIAGKERLIDNTVEGPVVATVDTAAGRIALSSKAKSE
jgi:hypothetical protein